MLGDRYGPWIADNDNYSRPNYSRPCEYAEYSLVSLVEEGVTAMKVTVLHEAGYDQVMLGLGLSHGLTSGISLDDLLANQPLLDRLQAIAMGLYDKDGGHNKFLESMIVYIDLRAPRYFHQQLDTYRVGMTKLSASTMHTLLKRPLTQDDFAMSISVQTLKHLNGLIADGLLRQAKGELPEGFLQRCIVCTNYQTLRRIFRQRWKHKLPEWQEFIRSVLKQAVYPEFLRDLV